MFKVTPDSPTIVVNAEPAPTGATLTASDRPSVELTITPDAPMNGLVSLGPVPTDTPDGVYTLNLATDCGCRQALIGVQMCDSPAFHTTPPDHDTPPTTECCDPPAPAPAPAPAPSPAPPGP